MTQQTKIATKILERAYARELIKAAVGAAPGLSSPAAWGAKPTLANPPTPAPPELPNKLVSAFGQGTSDTFSGISTGAIGLGNAGLFGIAGPIARVGQGLAYGDHKLTGNPEYANNAASRGALADSFDENTRAGLYDTVEAVPRMFGYFRDEPTHVEMLRQRQGQTLDPMSRAYFNGSNAVFDTATTAAATAPVLGPAAAAFPRVAATVAAAPIAYNTVGKPLAQMAVNDFRKLWPGNQAQAAEPLQAPQPAPEPAGVNYNDLSDSLNGGRPYGEVDQGMHNAANEFSADNNADQTEVAQDAAATPAQPAATPVEQPAPAQPAAEQPSDLAADYANLEPAKWTLPPNATPEQQQTVKDATNTINAAPPPVQQAVVARKADPTNAEAKATVDAAATENIIKSVTEDPAATANGATDFGALIGAKMEWYNKQDPHTQGLLALGLSAGVIGLISAINGGGLGSFLSMALGLGGAGLLGAATGAFGEDGQRAMGQGMASVGRMMGMDVPTDPVPVDRLVGENAPATIHADIMKQAPTLKAKMQLLTNKKTRADRAQSIRAELKQLDRVKQIAGLPEHAAVPLLMHLGQANKKPISLEVAKQVYRNAVQTAQMANDKDSDMGKQLAEAQQFAADPDAYVKPYQQAAGSALELGKMTNTGRLVDLGARGANWAYDKYRNWK